MSVTFFHGTSPLMSYAPIVVDWQQLNGVEERKHFHGQELFAQSRVAQDRAETLTELFEQNVSPSQKSKPVLRTLLNRILQLFDSEKDSKLIERSLPLTSKRSCITELALGSFGSLLTQHPLPLLLGLSQCFSRAQAQQKVGSEFQVNTYIMNDQIYPDVASFPNGNFVVTWISRDQDGSNWGVYAQLFNGVGDKIGSEFQVNTYTSDSQESPAVTALNNGNFVVTWQSYPQDGSSWGVYAQIFNETGVKFGSEFQVNTYTSDDQAMPSVSGLNDDHFVVTWHSLQDANGHGIYGQIFNGIGVKIGSEFRINTYENNEQVFPSVAGSNIGNFTVVWQSFDQDGNGYGIFGQLFERNGSKVGIEFRVNSYSIDDQWEPSVVASRSEKFIVSWASRWQDGDLSGVLGRLFNGQGDKIGNEFQVNTEFVKNQWHSDVACLNNDHFIVVWTSNKQDGSAWGVFGQLFDENGAKIGNEFRINTYTILDQSQPTTANLQDGNFVVTWNSYGQDGAGFGIYGQIFYDNFTFSSSSSTATTSQTNTTTASFVRSSSSSSSITTSTTSTSTISTTHAKTFDRNSMTSESSQMISSPSSNRNNVLAWLAFFLGGAACVASFVHAGYFLYKSKRRAEGGDSVELKERGSLDGIPPLGSGERRPEEEHYQRTPDHVHPL